MEKLYIVIPAYNEQDTIEQVAREWHEVVANISKESKLVIINDGSKDNTYEKLCHLKESLPQLEPLTKQNEGHGATLLYGYQYALDHGADYIFQTDSDGQTLPSEFGVFWEKRHDYSVSLGVNLLISLVKKAASLLEDSFDIEIIEKMEHLEYL